MLSRRHLRIKVLQALYAFNQSKNNRLDLGEKELLKSLDKLYELFIYQLSLIIEIVNFARKRLEENKLKFFPTESDLNPSTRFIENKFYTVLSNNKDFLWYCGKYAINWADEEDMVRKFLTLIKETQDYKDYIDAEVCSFNTDKEIFVTIFKKIISHSDILQFYYEGKNIYWYDDFFVSNLMVIKMIKSWEPHWDENHKLPLIFQDHETPKIDDDREFIINLFRKTIMRSDEYEKMIDAKVKNWEMDRIAIIDVILIKMALVELMESPSIPIKVTLNEYIELAKIYSTPKSKIFVNGILDKLIVDLKEQKLINKAGRGLMEV
jgi:transcription antitermination protein NusB